MDLTKEQKESLKKLSHYFEKLEKEAAQNSIDLDVFIGEYKDNGYAVYVTEQIDLQKSTKADPSFGGKATERKKVFQKSTKEKSEKVSATKSR